MKFATIATTAALLLTGSVASATVFEDFETGGFAPAWTLYSGGAAAIGPAGAHTGSFGVTDGNSGWYYRTDLATGTGTTLSAWTRGGSGRFYLGFGADAGGASSFVVAFNTGDVRFQNNPSYGFSELNVLPLSLVPDKWYRAEVVFGAANVTGNLYDTDGTTLLASLVASGLSYNPAGGVAVRGFGGVQYDDMSLSSAVPEPQSWALLIAGFGLVGATMRRRKAALAA